MTKQETIDSLYEIIQAHMRYSGINFIVNGQQFDISKIVANKPDINDEKNVFALFCIYNTIIGEPVVSQMIINK